MVNGSPVNSSEVMAFLVIPSEVSWSYFLFGVVLAIGLVTIFLRGDWQKARGLDRVILLFDSGCCSTRHRPACFGTEHFILTKIIASPIPGWIPWHLFWAYLVGGCFIAAALSLVTRIQARLAASMLGLTFFLFVVPMDAPTWARYRQNRIFLALALRELSSAVAPLALAASLSTEIMHSPRPSPSTGEATRQRAQRRGCTPMTTRSFTLARLRRHREAFLNPRLPERCLAGDGPGCLIAVEVEA
jgi:uncharacterized membrane protein